MADISSWTRSPWVKWSWLLVLAGIVAQSLDYQWRVLPTNATGYYVRGRADYVLRRYESAVDNLTKSIERRPDDAESYLLRGKAYARLQDLGKAMPDLRRALTLAPDYERVHAAFGDGRATAWDTAGAIEAYSRAIALDPTSARYALERGKALYDAGRLDDAAADLRRAATALLGDDQVTAYFLLWVARARAGEAFGASAELQKVMSAGRIRGDRFWTSARFLCGQLHEPAYLADLESKSGGNVDELSAERFLLAGEKRLAFGDQQEGLTLMRNVLRTGAETSYAYDRARVELENLLLGFHPMRLEDANDRLVVGSVTPGGPAEASGLRPGAVLAVGREPFLKLLETAKPGFIPRRLTPDSSAPTR
jgi:tetratricopeptide (TPR) repeat protein